MSHTMSRSFSDVGKIPLELETVREKLLPNFLS